MPTDVLIGLIDVMFDVGVVFKIFVIYTLSVINIAYATLYLHQPYQTGSCKSVTLWGGTAVWIIHNLPCVLR